MSDDKKDMAKSMIEELWVRYTDKLFKYYDHDWMSLQALYSRYIIDKKKKL